VVDRRKRAIGGNRAVVADSDAVPSVENAARVDDGAPPDRQIAQSAGGFYLHERVDDGFIADRNPRPAQRIFDVRQRRNARAAGDLDLRRAFTTV
jgi:hypothetical protein